MVTKILDDLILASVIGFICITISFVFCIISSLHTNKYLYSVIEMDDLLRTFLSSSIIHFMSQPLNYFSGLYKCLRWWIQIISLGAPLFFSKNKL